MRDFSDITRWVYEVNDRILFSKPCAIIAVKVVVRIFPIQVITSWFKADTNSGGLFTHSEDLLKVGWKALLTSEESWSQRVSIFVPAYNITNWQCILIVFLPSPEFVMTKEKTICLMKRIRRFNIKIRSPDMHQSRQINLSHSLLYQPKFGNVFRNSILLSLFLYRSQSFPITFLPIIDSL